MPAPANLVHQTSTTTGTGALTLTAVNGKQSFLTAFGTGGTDTFVYFVSNRDAAEYERGTGHENAGTLVRDTVIESTNANAAVNFSAGTKDITNDIPAATQLRAEAQTLTAAIQSTVRGNVSAALKGQIFGLKLSNGTDATNDIDIASGEAASTETNPVLMVLASTLTKQLDASWAVGTNAGGLDTGSIANTTYHMWLIRRSDTGVVDALFSASASAPTMPTNYDQKRRIGSIVRTGAAIKAFVQDGDLFQWTAGAVADISVANPGTAAATRTLTVPTGINVLAQLQLGFSTSVLASNPAGILVSDLAVNDVAPSVANATALNYAVAGTAANYYTVAQCRTNTSAQVRSRLQLSDANITLNINTIGWIDTRGRLA